MNLGRTVTCTLNTRTEQQIFIAKSLYLAFFKTRTTCFVTAKVILVSRSFKDQRTCRTFALTTKEFSRVTDLVYIYFLSASYYFVE